MRILTIIPARCGSKGIPLKNIQDVCGKPLISYSIEQGLQLKRNKLVEEVLVSTDCDEIAKTAKEYGASVPFLRPNEISTDNSKTIDLIHHALDYYLNIGLEFDSVLLLQPTSPLRSSKVLNQAIKLFKENNNDSLISVFREEYINDLVIYSYNGKTLVPKDKNHNTGIRRQDHSSNYVRNGAIYITRVDFLRNHSKIISDSPLMVLMKKSDSINIDTKEDLIILKKIKCK